MHTLLAPQRPRQDSLSSLPDARRLSNRDRRTTLLDRLALRVGLRLLLWGTRTPRLADDRARHADAYRHQEATEARERGHLHGLLLAPRL